MKALKRPISGEVILHIQYPGREIYNDYMKPIRYSFRGIKEVAKVADALVFNKANREFIEEEVVGIDVILDQKRGKFFTRMYDIDQAMNFLMGTVYREMFEDEGKDDYIIGGF